MRTKEELENVLKVLTHYRETLPEYSLFGDNNWKMADSQLYYINHALNFSTLCPMDEDDLDSDEVIEVYEWLKGYDYTDFYTDILEELEDII